MGAGKGKANRVRSASAAAPPLGAYSDAEFAKLLETLDPPQVDERWAEALLPASQMQKAAADLFATANRYTSFYGVDNDQAVRYRKRAEKKMGEAQALYKEINKPYQVEF